MKKLGIAHESSSGGRVVYGSGGGRKFCKEMINLLTYSVSRALARIPERHAFAMRDGQKLLGKNNVYVCIFSAAASYLLGLHYKTNVEFLRMLGFPYLDTLRGF